VIIESDDHVSATSAVRGRLEMSDPLGIVVMPVTQRRGYVLDV
jgi:hypothetical protein